jgi:hypothetical protein
MERRSRSKESFMGSGDSKPPSVSAAFIFAPSSGLHPRGWSFHPQPYEFILAESSRWYGTVSFLYQSQDSRLTPSRRSCSVLMVGGLSSAFLVKKTGSCPSSLPINPFILLRYISAGYLQTYCIISLSPPPFL